MIAVVTPDEMADIDAASPEPTDVLIDRAARAVATAALELMGGTYGRRVQVIAGKGNNGEDGRRAGAILSRRGAAVTVYDAVDCPLELPPTDLVIDAAYGTGYTTGSRGEWVAPDVRARHVLAVDIPSGVDGSSGAAAAKVLRADVTVTFAALKPGLLFGEGKDLAGRIEVADIGLEIGRSERGLVGVDDVAAWWRPRPASAHKWSSALRLIAGSPGMGGAAALAAAAAGRAGAGLVHLMSPGGHVEAPIEVITAPLPGETWHRAALRDIARFHALVIGPGLGRSEHNIEPATRTIADADVPVVVDGDALYALSAGPQPYAEVLRGRHSPTVLTPHDGEFSLLVGQQPGDDRIDTAAELAAECRCAVLLKGPTTVVASSSGRIRIVANGDQRLATAGAGDVLSGIIGALLATGMNAFDAAAAGAWIHAEASLLGDTHGLVASDLPELVPSVLARLADVRAGNGAGALRS